MPLLATNYIAPKFFSNPYIQTVYSIYLRRVPPIYYQREKLITPDQDFLYLDWLAQDPDRLVILTHGITGDSQTTYNRGMARAFYERGWSVLAWNMRGRGGQTANLRETSYHLGFTTDLRFIIQHAIEKKKYKQIFLVGFSMGGNIVLKYLGEEGASVNAALRGSIAFSAPIEAVSCGEMSDRSPNRYYTVPILKEMLADISAKSAILSPIVDIPRILRVKTWREFDELYTAPVFGFKGALEYRQKASAKPLLPAIQIPSLLVNAKDDPLLSAECYPEDEMVHKHPHFFAEFPQNGGHLGFVRFGNMRYYWSEARALEFAESVIT